MVESLEAVTGRRIALADGEVERLGSRVAELRSAIGADLEELDGRLDAALDVRRHAHRHPVLAAVVVVGAGFTVAAVATALWRHRAGEAEGPIEGRRVSGRRPRESIASRIAVTTASALCVLLARQLGKALLEHVMRPGTPATRGRCRVEDRRAR